MLCVSDIVLGKVGNVSRPDYVEVVSRRPLPLGTYVSIPFNEVDPITNENVKHCLIGVVSSTKYRRAIPVSGAATLESEELYTEFEQQLAQYGSSFIRVFADIVGNTISTPRIPPPPNANVYLAPSNTLELLFSRKGESSIPIGHLVGRPDVTVYVDVNALVKHLFVTGTTGSGKSNTVAIVIDRVAKLGGMIIVYDVHGEYTALQPLDPNIKIKVVDLYINPLRISPNILAKMIVPEGSATVQRRLVLRALREAQKLFESVLSKYGATTSAIEELRRRLGSSTSSQQLDDERFGEPMSQDIDRSLTELYKRCVLRTIERYRSDAVSERSREAAIMKVEEFFEFANVSFTSPSPIELLEPRTIVVLNASALDDEQRDYMLKVIADELLWFAKHSAAIGRPRPVVLVIEEAHLFLSTSRETSSRRSIERLSREGRKFGISLIIVSQRPRNIDTNTVSQIQNFVFMKLVQEADQQAIMNASDMLTDDLAKSLSSMDTGEAIILGEWIGRFPAFVKIDKHIGKRSGASPNIAKLWRNLAEEYEIGKRSIELHTAAYNDLKDLL
ncbi:MAG TPA: ATP-binding protein [Ignisphaera aggregans]|uniref:ATP-binding protein n=1 Tax=Ignisphaera aggregans TaxID=334771 RepID=A0A833DTA9_9CREN|nr:ATP-binding protein [Ignisphaera aggregans]